MNDLILVNGNFIRIYKNVGDRRKTPYWILPEDYRFSLDKSLIYGIIEIEVGEYLIQINHGENIKIESDVEMEKLLDSFL